MASEFSGRTASGWTMLAVNLGGGLASTGGLIYSIVLAARAQGSGSVTGPAVMIVGSVLAMVFFLVMLCGHFTLQPNEGGVLLLFGRYKGTVRHEGFHWANPFLTKIKVSLRARNFNGEKLKVNDQRGSPIEIAAVVVWRVHDTAQACFDVDDYKDYVHVQSESAVRHLASSYPYDSADDHTVSLRGSTDQVSKALQSELQERLRDAGVVVEEARLSHLAYAPEIAGAMLQRQQAEAIVAARARIVEGACGMVEMALSHLESNKTVDLDAERKAAMVSNLLVVLCGDKSAHPVVNAGSLYT